ncbi:MAG TPA: dTMP kinase [Acidobacteriota bacterium]|nr:dTMP kinase [Acidobacteriota bacterium]
MLVDVLVHVIVDVVGFLVAALRAWRLRGEIFRMRLSRKKFRELLLRREEKRGFLIAFEGPDGSGKTTQRKLFKEWLLSEGHQVVTTKWNSSPLIKPLIQARKAAQSLSPKEFCLLHAADFQHRLENVILPALWQGSMVVADRYIFTALSRDAARGLEFDWMLHVYVPLFWPDIVFYFSVSTETSGERIAATRLPKFYEAGMDVTNIADPFQSHKQFIGRVIQEYKALALIFQFVTVDAEQSIYDQHQFLRRLFQQSRRRSWAEYNMDALLDWLEGNPQIAEVQVDV